MTAIRNVIFDLGGVVLEWNPDQIVARFQPDAALRENFKKDVFGHPDWQLFDRGALTELQMIDRIESRTGLPKNQAANIMDSVRESLVEKSATVRLMRSLHSRGVTLFCLSNMPTSIYTHLRERHGFWDLFTGIVISGDVRMMKPEAAVFDYLLRKFSISAAESVFIDDLAANIQGAIAVGLQGVLFQDARQCERDLNRLLLERASTAYP
ncbi:MAG TPA: HAD family phosphatase [Steroidobacteraceae bacterium]